MWPIFITRIPYGPLAYLSYTKYNIPKHSILFLAEYLFEICICAKLAAEICPPVSVIEDVEESAHAYHVQH